MNSFLSLLGIARKAGKVEIGDEASRAAISKRRAKLTVLSSDASERTKKVFCEMSSLSDVACVISQSTMKETGDALGKRPTAVVTICDAGLASAAAEKLSLKIPDVAGAKKNN